MEAKELRIGNYIYKSLKSGTGRIIEEKAGCQDIVRIFEGIGSFDYSPILLNESWLIKFGYTYVEPAFAYCDKNHLIYKCKENKWMFEPYCTNDADCWVEIQYVHQLQNIHFALTGEELHTQAGGV